MQNLITPDDTPDRILRLALLACAADRRSALTRAQRATVIAVGGTDTAVPLAVLLLVREVLLRWCEAYRPGLTETVATQYALLERRARKYRCPCRTQ